MESLESTAETFVFDILICQKWLDTNHKHYYINTTLAYRGMDDNTTCHLWNQRYTVESLGMCHNFNIPPQMSHRSQGIPNHRYHHVWKVNRQFIVTK